MAHISDPISEEGQTGRNRCCFCLPSFSRRSSGVGLSFWERVRSSRTHADSQQEQQNPWWARGIQAVKRVREWSEIVAGPKWKTFIRRFNRGKGNGKGRHGKFQYDPLSYALNFDEGPGQNGYFDEEDDGHPGFRDFSSRYAAVSGSGRPLAMDAPRSGVTSNDVAAIA